jgi:hypothetical protein
MYMDNISVNIVKMNYKWDVKICTYFLTYYETFTYKFVSKLMK